jgi:hypothetical protein
VTVAHLALFCDCGWMLILGRIGTYHCKNQRCEHFLEPVTVEIQAERHELSTA